MTGLTGVAIGAKASATGDSGVAIGGRAVDANGNPLVTDANGDPAPGASASGTGATAIGASANAVGQSSTALGIGSAATGDAATALGGAATANGARSLAAGFHASVTADDGLALGSDAQTVATNGIAIGSGAQAGVPFSGVDATNAIALGFRSAAMGAQSVALGAAAIASGEHSVALGTDSFADRDASVSVGNAIFGLKRQITNVADGTDDTDAATVGQVRQVFATGVQQAAGFASFLGGGSIVGMDGVVQPPSYLIQGNTYHDVGSALSTLDGAVSHALDGVRTLQGQGGSGAIAVDGAAGGRQASVPVGSGGVAVGSDSVVSAASSVALGQGSVADRANTVSVGTVSNTRQITSVGAGALATDAANTGQVDQALATARSYADAGDQNTLDQARSYTDSKLGNLVSRGDFDNYRRQVSDQFQQVNKRLDQVGAMGTAMAQMAFSTQGVADENRLGFGAGAYGGRSAFAVGYSRQLTRHANVTFGGAVSGSETSAGVGVGMGW
ncbi:hypothetical protein J2T07_003083 [Luteibacter jiangsuensis]|uniref:Trimeric autotransporter adhesin n=1 Tax=Luteibacter jiangsuensis TaxID=637577 RepID=A0ABT9T0V6_9GAMM|nr:YadA-like family protein [Luteibacter jiangsuensis]MDQ0010877.1 hypothetical protein [Luteibacter jiangsuensis]